MKKLLIISNLVLLGIIAYLVFFKHDLHQPPPEEHLKGVISFQAAEMISHNYSGDTVKSKLLITTPDGESKVVDDTKSVSFNLKGLNAFIAGIERAAKKVGCDKPLGVRIYFSKYPDAETMKRTPTLKDVPAEYANKLTFFFVPTIFDGNKFRDFNPVKWTDCNNPPYYTKKSERKSGDDNNSDDDDWIYNHGDLIPPPYPGDDFPPSNK